MGTSGRLANYRELSGDETLIEGARDYLIERAKADQGHVVMLRLDPRANTFWITEDASYCVSAAEFEGADGAPITVTSGNGFGLSGEDLDEEIDAIRDLSDADLLDSIGCLIEES